MDHFDSPEILGCSEPGQGNQEDGDDGHPLTQGQMHSYSVHEGTKELDKKKEQLGSCHNL